MAEVSLHRVDPLEQSVVDFGLSMAQPLQIRNPVQGGTKRLFHTFTLNTTMIDTLVQGLQVFIDTRDRGLDPFVDSLDFQPNVSKLPINLRHHARLAVDSPILVGLELFQL